MTSHGPGPAVSVITIFHNEERFLPQAVASVSAQEGATWELLLVDDGSTDRSGELARDLARRDPDRIRYLSHDGMANLGMSASRNLGIDNARGRWVTFLDADDVWLPGKLALQLRVLDDHPGIDVLVSPAQWWFDWDRSEGGEQDRVQRLTDRSAPATVVDPPTLLTQFLEDEWLSICDLLISRAGLDRIGGYEPAFRSMFEDQVFHAKVFSQLPAVVTTQWWYRYRQHDAACTATAHNGGAHRHARKLFLEWLDSYLAEGGTGGSNDQALRGLVRRQRRALNHRHLRRAGRLATRLTSPVRKLPLWSPGR
ncbi:MAG: glycosyltransferase family 2 protein [Acidimicrobiales bacterium]